MLHFGQLLQAELFLTKQFFLQPTRIAAIADWYKGKR